MTQLDFRDTPIWDRIRHGFMGVAKTRKPVLYLCGLVGLLFVTETARFIIALGHLRDTEARRASIAIDVEALKRRAATLHDVRRTLTQALQLRRTNARLAIEIAEIGNALAPDLAVTALRNTEIGEPAQSIEIDGRTTNIAAIVRTLQRLPVTGNFDFQREDAADGEVSFRFGMAPEHNGVSK